MFLCREFEGNFSFLQARCEIVFRERIENEINIIFASQVLLLLSADFVCVCIQFGWCFCLSNTLVQQAQIFARSSHSDSAAFISHIHTITIYTSQLIGSTNSCSSHSRYPFSFSSKLLLNSRSNFSVIKYAVYVLIPIPYTRARFTFKRVYVKCMCTVCTHKRTIRYYFIKNIEHVGFGVWLIAGTRLICSTANYYVRLVCCAWVKPNNR